MDKSEVAAKSNVSIGIHYEGSDTSGPFDEVRGVTVYHDEDGNPIDDPALIEKWESEQAEKLAAMQQGEEECSKSPSASK